MIANRRVPEIRFKGFSGEWEEKELFSASEFINENLILAKLTGKNYISTENILPNFLGVIVSSKLPNLKTVTCFKKNDILISNIRPYLKKVWSATFNGGASNDVIVIRAKHNINNKYLTHIIKNEHFINYVMEGVKGVKMPRGDISLIKKYPLSISQDIVEQTKIGNYFQHLDRLIEEKAKKEQKLKSLKKAMLQKMFPKDGTTTPEIRFKGFSGEWEREKLGDIGKTFTGLSGKTKVDFGHGEGKFVTYMNVFSNSISKQELIEPIEIDNNQNQVKFGDVFFTTSSETPEEVGMSSVWMHKEENIYLNSFCFGYRPEKLFDNYYLAYMLRSSSIRKKIIFLGQGISRYNISKNKVMEIFVPIPTKPEQTKIGNYFQKLDSLINLQHQELEKLKNLKKAFLSKMFV